MLADFASPTFVNPSRKAMQDLKFKRPARACRWRSPMANASDLNCCDASAVRRATEAVPAIGAIPPFGWPSGSDYLRR